MRDAAIVGGGPAGSLSARLLSGFCDVTVLETHPVSGLPLGCTGLVSPEVISLSGVKPDILHSISKVRAVFPDGRTMQLDAGGPQAILIDRPQFDRLLAESAMDAGTEFRYGTKVSDVARAGDHMRVITPDGEVRSRLVIGADGPSSVVRGLVTDRKPKLTVRGLQYDVRHTMDEQDSLDVLMGADVAPGFFAWEIPFGEFTRVGLCSQWDAPLPAELMRNLLKRTGLQDAEVVRKVSGKIPLGVSGRTYADNLMLIGDSAVQVKPISGGGLFPIVNAAPCLAHTVQRALEQDDLSARSLSGYEKEWKKAVGSELKHGFRLRKMYNNLSDSDLNSIGRIVDNDRMRELAHGASLDSPSKLVRKALHNVPMVLRLLPYLIKGLI